MRGDFFRADRPWSVPPPSICTFRIARAAPAAAVEIRGSFGAMAGYDDDDDWVGEPPEGRFSRDRAKPDFWRRPWPLAGVGIALVLVVVLVVLITR